MKLRSRVTAAIGALATTVMLAATVPALGHTIYWDPATYTTPITDWANPNYRCAPISGWFGEGLHQGGQYYAIDISVPVGADVYAPKGGMARYVWNVDANGNGGGNVIWIDHAENGGYFRTVLAHLSTVNIRTDGGWQWVNKNQWIGESGRSGNVAPHLHWHMVVRDHLNDKNYGANLDWIPGVNGPPTRTVCG